MDEATKNKIAELAASLPECVSTPIGLHDLEAIGDSVFEKWEKGEVKNIRWVIDSLIRLARFNTVRYGENLIECRAEIIKRDKRIQELEEEIKSLRSPIPPLSVIERDNKA